MEKKWDTDLKDPNMRRAKLGSAAGEVKTPAAKAPVDNELNWVQKMTKQVHTYLTKKKKEGSAAVDNNYPAPKPQTYPDLEKKAADLKAAGKNPAETDLMKRQIANRRGVK